LAATVVLGSVAWLLAQRSQSVDSAGKAVAPLAIAPSGSDLGELPAHQPTVCRVTLRNVAAEAALSISLRSDCRVSELDPQRFDLPPGGTLVVSFKVAPPPRACRLRRPREAAFAGTSRRRCSPQAQRRRDVPSASGSS